MRSSRALLSSFLIPALAAPLTLLTAGCGDGLPENNTVASPVNKEEAASQNKAMQDFANTKKKSGTGRTK